MRLRGFESHTLRHVGASAALAAVRPAIATDIQNAGDRADGRDVQAVEDPSTVSVLGDEPRLGELLEVMAHRRLAEPHLGRQLPGRELVVLAPREERDDRDPGRFREGPKAPRQLDRVGCAQTGLLSERRAAHGLCVGDDG